MCRLALFQGVVDELELAWSFAELELSFGGHGNGLWLSENDRVTKGVNTSVTELAKLAKGSKGVGIFHTRLASCGGKQDKLCHPFREKGKWDEYVVAHNGHWNGWYGWPGASDTETATKLIADHGVGILMNSEFNNSGMWIVHWRKYKQTFLVNRGGNFVLQWLEQEKDEEPRFFHASEPILALESQVSKSERFTPDNHVYLLEDDGMVVKSNVETAEMPEREYKYSGSSYVPGEGWTHPKDRPPGWSGSYRGGSSSLADECYCTKVYTCTKCKAKEQSKPKEESEDLADIMKEEADWNTVLVMRDADTDELYFCYCASRANSDYQCTKCKAVEDTDHNIEYVDEFEFEEVQACEIELEHELGRSPTDEEVIQYMEDLRDLEAELAEELEVAEEKDADPEATQEITVVANGRYLDKEFTCMYKDCEMKVTGTEWFCHPHQEETLKSIMDEFHSVPYGGWTW